MMYKLFILLAAISLCLPAELLARGDNGKRENRLQKHSQQHKMPRVERHHSSRNQIRRSQSDDHGNQVRTNHPDQHQSRVYNTRHHTSGTNNQLSRHSNQVNDRRHTSGSRQHHSYSTRHKPLAHSNSYNHADANKHQYRRHHVRHNEHNRYRKNHYRGNHRYSRWNAGHGHYHYDYNHRSSYNSHQWYADYYYQAYFNWRLNQGNRWGFGAYNNNHQDPYYCPDGFSTFISGLTIGSLIYNW